MAATAAWRTVGMAASARWARWPGALVLLRHRREFAGQQSVRRQQQGDDGKIGVLHSEFSQYGHDNPAMVGAIRMGGPSRMGIAPAEQTGLDEVSGTMLLFSVAFKARLTILSGVPGHPAACLSTGLSPAPMLSLIHI